MKKTLTFSETFEMINYVCETVIDFDNKTGKYQYLPELFDYAYRASILRFYYEENIDQLDLETSYQKCMELDIKKVRSEVNRSQLDGIYKSICEKIEYKKSEIHKENINIVSELDSIVPFINEILITINDKLGKIDTKKINKLLSSLNAKTLIQEYLDSDRYSGNTASIIDQKNKKIEELKEKLIEKDENK